MPDFIPTNDGDKIDWLNNYKTEITTNGPTVGLTAAQITNIQNQISAYLTQWNALVAERAHMQSTTTTTRQMEKTLFAALRQQVSGIKNNSGYTDAIGDDLDIVGTVSAFDPDSFKPTFTATVMPGSVRLDFVKDQTDGVNVYSRLKGQPRWKFVARDTNSPYEDYTPLAQPGVPEAREYAMRGVIKDKEIGQMSDIVGVTYGG